jgi:hypothetical protein
MGLHRFAQRHGLKPGQLHYWVYQSAKAPMTQEPLPSFQEVRLPAPQSVSRMWGAEIGLSDGLTVRLAQGSDLAWAMALIDSLRRPCSSH